VTEAERLITKEHVDIILGTYASSLSMVASEVANKHKKLYWETDGNSDKLTQRGYPYYFRTNPPASRYTEWSPRVIKEYILPRIGKTAQTVRIAGLHEDSLFGQTMGQYITKNVKNAGMDFVYSEFYNRKTIDLSSIIMKLKQANPDILMATQYLVDLIAFWRQCKELNYSPPIYLGSGAGVSMPDFLNAVGAVDAEGMMEMSFAAPLSGVNPKYGLGMQEFLNRYKKTFGRDCVSMYQAPNYAGAQLLFAAISKANSTKPEDVRNGALSLDMPFGTLVVGWGAKFDTSGQNTRTKVLACQWLDGKVWAVWPPEATLPGKEMKIPLPNWEQRKKK
jgi:branched-chain amino acid transport system substrate-binding protein